MGKFPPEKRPQPGDIQISSKFLNSLLTRIERLEKLHANSPLRLEDSRGGLCLSLTKDIQNFRLAQAQEIHNGDNMSSLCKISRFNGSTETFEADDLQEIEVYDPFGVGFWPDDIILVTKYYDSGQWIHIPIRQKQLYGITQDALVPCDNISVERVTNAGLTGEFYQAYNPHDWDAPSGVFIQSKWEPILQQYMIYSADCEASCLGL